MPKLPVKSKKIAANAILEMSIDDGSRPPKKSKTPKKTGGNGNSRSGYVVKRNYDPTKLTSRQKRFVQEYCVDCNGTRAARAAGFNSDASVASCKLLAHPVVKAAIAKRQMFLAQGFTIKSKDVLRQLIYTLTRDAMDFCDPETGQMITDIRLLPARARASIDGIEQEVTILHDSRGQPVGQRIKTKLKLVPKAKAIEMAMQHKGLFKPTNASSEKVDVDWDKISQDNQRNPIDEIVADPMKYLTSRVKEVESNVVEPEGTE